MGLYLPDWLTEPAAWVGLDWPQADEVLLAEAGQAWLEFAVSLMPINEAAEKAAVAVWAENDGPATDAFEQWWTDELGPRERLFDDYVAAIAVGAALLAFAAITLAVKLAFIVQLVQLVVIVVEMVIAGIMTGGGAAAAIGAQTAAIRVAIKVITQQLVKFVTTVLKEALQRAGRLFKRSRYDYAPDTMGPGSVRSDVRDDTPGWGPAGIPGPLKREDPLYAQGPWSKYRGENDPNNPDRAYYPDTVRYLSKEEREEHRLVVQDGKLITTDGEPFDTADASTLRSGSDGRAIFAMDENGNLYASAGQEKGKFHHSSLLGGEPAVAAGEFKVKDGKLQYLNNQSGHYTPTDGQIVRMIRELQRQGLDIKGVDYGSVR
ncbi:hypothetical protein [Actinopolymorpha sp. B9G3]|uniref:hypothetical protein n=1 Tax=Actinopolymorpha sp. B9G3 TaxID=3158970 RepID=UPI0032D991DE